MSFGDNKFWTGRQAGNKVLYFLKFFMKMIQKIDSLRSAYWEVA